jgi:DNA-binding transcriptional MerR regulator
MLLKIGDFAKLGHVSTRMLRHYDKLGLLKPINTAPITGYRFHSIDQLPRLKRICVLRDLGFALDDIEPLLDDNGP